MKTKQLFSRVEGDVEAHLSVVDRHYVLMDVVDKERKDVVQIHMTPAAARILADNLKAYAREADKNGGG